MQIYDISQEVFGCVVYPGDTAPSHRDVRLLSRGDNCNLTDFTMCAHNGTHVDAPRHFLDEGCTIDAIPLEQTVGEAYVVTFDREITSEDISSLPGDCRRLLVRGSGWMTPESSRAAVVRGIGLIGTESQSVGPAGAPRTTHLALLGAGVVLLEGIRLAEVPDGKYLLFAAPINLGGCEGAPVRAVLVRN